MAAAAGETGQALESKRISPRITAGDAVVIVAAVLALLVGWGIKGWHDNRLHETEVEGVTIAYPKGWIAYPAAAPVLLKAISVDDGRSQVLFSASETTQTDVLLAMASGIANQASGETAYTQLGNETAEVDGQAAVRSDYAYVRTKIGAATPPTVMHGRQYAWIREGKLYTLAMEAPEEGWDEAKSDFERMIDKVEV